MVFSVVKCCRTLENSNSSFVLASFPFLLVTIKSLVCSSTPPHGRSEDFHFLSFLFFVFFCFCVEYNCGEIRLLDDDHELCKKDTPMNERRTLISLMTNV